MRLIDEGKESRMSKKDLFTLPEKFYIRKSFAFYTHLSQVPEADAKKISSSDIENILRPHPTLFLLLRAKPELKNEVMSAPGDIGWKVTTHKDPFSPSVTRRETLSESLSKCGFLTWRGIEDLQDEENLLKEDAFIDVLDNKTEIERHEKQGLRANNGGRNSCFPPAAAKFQWAGPVLPTSRKFHARGTHVDNAGQVYMHLYSDRQRFTELRRTLRNHYEDSEPDCEPGSFEPNDAVVCKWKEADGYQEEWYRASFIQYELGSNFEVCHVYFVDWGNISAIETKFLRKNLRPDVMETPVLAFKTCLSNVLPYDGKDWRVEALDFMNEKINYENNDLRGGRNVMKVEVISSAEKLPLLVDILLYTPINQGTMRHTYLPLADLVVERGDGVKATIAEVDSKKQRARRKKHEHQMKIRFRKASKYLLTKPYESKEEVNVAIPKRVFTKVPVLEVSTLRVSSGSLLQCRVQSLLSWDKLVVHLVSEEKMKMMTGCFEFLNQYLQRTAASQQEITIPRYV